MRLSFVGEGKRDRVMMPNLTENLLATSIETCNTEDASWLWPRVHGGWRRKLKFAVVSAIDDGAWGLVATRDGDDHPTAVRKELGDARQSVRTETGFPVAIGCPNPHAEAWLLDDREGIRTVLRLESSTTIPAVSADSKQDLNALMEASPEWGKDIYQLLAELASTLSIVRCAQAQETGLKAFREDLRDAFATLLGA